MSAIDYEIKGVMSGILVACFILVVIQGQKPQAKECVASLKDRYGNIHEIRGVIHDGT
jgi:hypothetical protein